VQPVGVVHTPCCVFLDGEHILIGVTVLEELDLMVNCHRNRLVPYQGTPDHLVFRI
jgi:hypothetical protein